MIEGTVGLAIIIRIPLGAAIKDAIMYEIATGRKVIIKQFPCQ